MAKKPNPKKSNINTELLAKIAATPEGQVFYVSKDDGLPLINNDPPLIEVNTAMVDENGNAAARLTEAGQKMVADVAPAKTEAAPNFNFEILDDVVLPPSKRGNKGGGAKQKYPFDKLEVGKSFFVPATAELPEPGKTLGSTVSSANQRYATDTGEKKAGKRAKKGPDGKPMKDAAGKKIMEEVQVPVYNYSRKFTIRAVKVGDQLGSFKATADGAIIQRVQ